MVPAAKLNIFISYNKEAEVKLFLWAKVSHNYGICKKIDDNSDFTTIFGDDLTIKFIPITTISYTNYYL